MSVTDPAQRRRRQRRAADQLLRLVSVSSDAVLVLDDEDVVEVANERFARLTGIPSDAVVGHHVDELLAPLRTAADGAPDDTRALPPGATRLHHLLDGTARIVRETWAPCTDHRGRPAGTVVTFHDVTPQHEANQVKTDFVARVSHELRTPLTPIAGFARMLLARSTSLDAESHDLALRRIIDRADHLARLVDDLLRVAELTDPGLAERTLEPVGLRRTLTASLRDVGDDHEGRTVRTAMLDDTSSAMVLGDEQAIREVLAHVLDNALRYSPDDSTVEVTVQRSDVGTISIAVSDRGPGVPREERERIFEAFHRLDDPLHMTTSGIGVGLFLARHLARSMGGDVTYRTHSGRGATFVVNLLTGGALPRVDRRPRTGKLPRSNRPACEEASEHKLDQ